MCKRSMDQYTEPEADKGDAAAPGPGQRAGTSGDTDGAGGMPLAPAWEAEKKKQSARERLKRPTATAAGEQSARERLKRHRTEVAGRVRIPDMWGQERLLNDWVVDCAVFDRPLAATRRLLAARDALVAECAAVSRTPHGHGSALPERSGLRVQSGCS